MSFARPLFLSLSLSLGLATLFGVGPVWAESAAVQQRRLDAAIAAESAVDPRAVREFYRLRGNQAVWTDPATLAAQARAAAEAAGLDPGAYAVPTGSGIDADVARTATILRLARDAAIGRVAPDRALGGFGTPRSGGFDSGRFLRGLAEGRPLSDQVVAAQPPFVGHLRLIEALERTRAIVRAGGWPTVPDGPKLVPGESDPRVPALRRRLSVTGDFNEAQSDDTLFDPALTEAVRRFQRRHGLEADGVVGARTLLALNVSAEDRLRQISLNLERWRWLPRQFGRLHVSVNIPAATLELVEDGAVILTMRVVVGDVRHPTPSMNATMSSVVLNPPWSVPTSIANNEILPKLRRDPNYLSNSNLRIADYPEDSPEAAGDGIDWNAIGKKFPYRLRQPPGPDNALGRLKFNLRDSDDIYLHDTPNRRAFSRADRALSHGCVRLEQPVALGEALLGARWQGRLDDALTSDKSTRTFKLERSAPVYLVYFTAWAESTGEVHFRDDLYGHDRRLRQALGRSRSPVPGSEGRSAVPPA